MKVIVEGLDLTGKSTVANYIADEVDELDYLKVGVGDLFDYSGLDCQREINKQIMAEMAAVIEAKDNIVMDRGAISTAATGSLLDPELTYEELIENRPQELIPDIGVILSSSEETLESRKRNSQLTEQDKKVLSGNYFEVQQKMLEDAEDYIHISNNYSSIDQLHTYLDNEIMPEINVLNDDL